MDVTSWNVASRMKLPDYCFGNRQVISCYVANNVDGTRVWTISDIALPDPVCIWELAWSFMADATGVGWIRMGLADAVPTSQAEMDATTPILPYLGTLVGGPPQISMPPKSNQYVAIKVRKGMVTDGKKMVLEVRSATAVIKAVVWVLVSELPDKVPGWPGAWPAG